MEHRTLKQRDDNCSRSVKNLSMHLQNMKNLHHLVQTVEGYENSNNSLPPPARILPISGMKPQDSHIIRPVAFRPFSSKKTESRQSATSTSSSFYAKKDDSNSKRHCSQYALLICSSAFQLSKFLDSLV
ncbi:hypothetical protein AB6A40_009791 [Gnathostoma spinigerum]|uniref:Uncharacterized protein n=1 Tax=Gnathostoma spinigerum TaxID=75299 RepID=A0ABD6EVF0_9BILA